MPLRPRISPCARGSAPLVRARRVRQRRQMYIGQVASYSLGAFVLLLYAFDGVISDDFRRCSGSAAC